MWRRLYLLCVLVRLYFAFSPSYIHPDENFQGPEVIAGRTFGFPHHLTWEFDPLRPVRSVFPLWLVYGVPMVTLRWLWTETGHEAVAPRLIYYTLRAIMFGASFVLEDWAIHELLPSPRRRRVATLLVASSYVTWTYQTHTFSNAVETIVVLWSIVFIQRILERKNSSSVYTSAALGTLVAFGIFNRVTFPVYLLTPGLPLLPHFIRKPYSLLAMGLAAAITSALALLTDIHFYNPSLTLLSLLRILITQPLQYLTPINNLHYNLSLSNLAEHGLHPHYLHFLVNFPLLLGPAIILIFTHSQPTPYLIPPLLATGLLSLAPHQEPRFLLPAIPLLLTSLHLPQSRFAARAFGAAWIAFNVAAAIIYGIYHQGGIVPMQIWLGEHAADHQLLGLSALWWRTYSPPIWLLDGAARERGLHTQDLMGLSYKGVLEAIDNSTAPCRHGDRRAKAPNARHATLPSAVVVVAPRSSLELDAGRNDLDPHWSWEEMRTEWRHFNLDDLDFGADGVLGTARRVVGRRGLSAWKVRRRCRSERT